MLYLFESITIPEYIRGVNHKNWKAFDRKLWQRNYWEHIIPDEKSHQTISKTTLTIILQNGIAIL